MKQIEFIGDSLEQIRFFPADARRDAGYQLRRVQKNMDPSDWKPMRSIGKGVREIRIREDNGAFRVIYLAKPGETIYVLHAFQKKTRKAAKKDIDLARKRLTGVKK